MKKNLTIAALTLCLSAPCLAADDDYKLQVQIQSDSQSTSQPTSQPTSTQVIVNTGSEDKPTPLLTSDSQESPQFLLSFDKEAVLNNNLQFTLKQDGQTIYCSSSESGSYIPFTNDDNKTLSSLTLVLESNPVLPQYACSVNVKDLTYN